MELVVALVLILAFQICGTYFGMKFLAGAWIAKWAEINSLELIDYEYRWFDKGAPFSFPATVLFPIYRIEAKGSDGINRRGWVCLDAGFFSALPSPNKKGALKWDQE